MIAVRGLFGGGYAQPDDMVVVRNRSVVLVRCEMPMDDGSAVVVVRVVNVLRRGDARERNGLRNQQCESCPPPGTHDETTI